MSSPNEDRQRQRALTFARNLINRRAEKGFSQSDLAARASYFLPEKRSFSRASVSRYESGENIPGPATLAALAKALECEPGELLPARREAASPRSPMGFEMEKDGMVKLSLDMKVPLDLAMHILDLVKSYVR